MPPSAHQGSEVRRNTRTPPTMFLGKRQQSPMRQGTLPLRPLIRSGKNFPHVSTPAEPGIEGITDALSQEVVAQYRKEDGQPGIEGKPPGDVDVVFSGG